MKQLDLTAKPVIGMVHLLPCPSSPFFDNDIDAICKRALKDAMALKEGGVDGMIVENGNDGPNEINEDVDLAVIAIMSSITSMIVKETGLPVGVNVVANATKADLAICKASGASFIRATSWANGYFAKTGFVRPTAAEGLRYRKNIDATDVKILADVQVKNGSHLFISDKSIAEQCADLKSAGADAIIITGNSTGVEPDFNQLKTIKEKVGLPILVGSGATKDNITKFLDYSDGVIIGTYFKKNRRMIEPVETDLVREFMDVINDYRHK